MSRNDGAALRIDDGGGYLVCFRRGDAVVILLCGGDKQARIAWRVSLNFGFRDPLLPFEIDTMNGRRARESGP